VIYFGVFPHVTLNGYYDVMGIIAAQWHDVIQILPISEYKSNDRTNVGFSEE